MIHIIGITLLVLLAELAGVAVMTFVYKECCNLDSTRSKS
jgi:hypothetical protein